MQTPRQEARCRSILFMQMKPLFTQPPSLFTQPPPCLCRRCCPSLQSLSLFILTPTLFNSVPAVFTQARLPAAAVLAREQSSTADCRIAQLPGLSTGLSAVLCRFGLIMPPGASALSPGARKRGVWGASFPNPPPRPNKVVSSSPQPVALPLTSIE